MSGLHLYLCDRRSCEDCGSDCKHTTDIEHAKNFELDEAGNYVERAHPIVVFKTNCMLPSEIQNKIREKLKQQVAEGVVFCTGEFEPLVMDCDSFVFEVSVKRRFHHLRYK